MATIINAGTTALTITPDATGQLTLQANGVTALTANTTGYLNFAKQPTIAGYYQLNGAVSLNATTMSICIAFIYKNGSEFKRGTDIRVSQSNDSIATISTLVYANGTSDYFELYGFIAATSGSPIFVASQSSTWLQGFLVKAV